jgi:leucine dehydrogenase
MELYALLEHEGITEAKLLLDPSARKLRLTLARTHDERIDWSAYGSQFSSDTVPCTTPRAIGDTEARDLFARHCGSSVLARLEALMIEGRHEMASIRICAPLGVRTALFVHSSTLGRNNGLHAIRAGGFRRHDPNEDELEVYTDGLNLARAMSYKNAAADLPLGGCKMTVQCAPVALDDSARLGFIAYAIDSGRFVTGPDMGFLPEHSDAIRAAFSRHTTGGLRGSMGPTGTPTALGCFHAIQEAAPFALGARALEGKRAAVQGLGAVGLPLAEHLVKAGMIVTGADPDPRTVERAKERLPSLTIVAPDQIMELETELLAPCAVGGVLDERSIPRLRAKMVYGSANNPLRATSKEEEIRLARHLAERGVLFQIEWTHNTAGVMAGFEEYVHGEAATMARLLPRLLRVCRDGTRSILEEASRTQKTPTEVAYERVERRIHPELTA